MEKAQLIVARLLEDMGDRRGFDGLLDSLDEETLAEIKSAWQTIVEAVLFGR